MRYRLLGLLCLGLPVVGVCAGTPVDNTLQESVEQEKPLRLTVAWGKTTHALPGTEAGLSEQGASSSALQPTAAFLRSAHRLSVASERAGSGTLSTPDTDLVYRLQPDGPDHYQTELAVDTHLPDESQITRTTLRLTLGQWVWTGGSREQHSAEVDGQPVKSTIYRYQFVCLADQRGCRPPVSGSTP